MTAETTHRGSAILLATGTAAFLVAFFLLLGRLGPFAPGFLSPTLDGSWAHAAAYALDHRLRFGEDFVFTAGPLSPVYSAAYAGDAQLLITSLSVAIAVFIAYALAKLAVEAARTGRLLGGGLAILAIVVLILSFVTPDTLLMAPAVLTAVLYADHRARPIVVLVGVTLAAAAGLAKFSFLLLALGSFVVVDVLSITRRDIPFKTLAFAAATAGLWVISGQELAGLTAFVAASVEVTSGYSEAMSLDGPWYDLALWLTAASAVLILVVHGEVAAVRAHRADLPTAVAKATICLGFIPMLLKAGFVRHDQHDIIAWAGLGLAALAFHRPVATSWRGMLFSPMRMVGLGACILAIGITVIMWDPQRVDPGHLVRTASTQLSQAVALASSPSDWKAGLSASSAAAAATARASFPLPRLSGSVDMIPSRQAAVIAAGLDYRPRPTVQDYTTYTPALIARNRAFFESEHAPENLLFGLFIIDNRHPASSEGALWPLFLRRYETAGEYDGGLILRKRASPIGDVLGPATTLTTAFNSTVELPAGDRPWFAKLDIEKTAVGSLAAQLYRLPSVYLVLGYADGTEERFRLIPGQIRDGMVISPRVNEPADYAAIERGTTASLRRPTRFRIEAQTPGDLFYRPSITVSLQEIIIPQPASP